MLSYLLLSLLTAVAVNASPLPASDVVGDVLDPVMLDDEIMVYAEDGRKEIIKETAWLDHLKVNNISLEAIPMDKDFLNFHYPEVDGNLGKRQSCDRTNSVIVDKTQTFVDWDIQMSPVACATFGPVDIFVTSGWSVANSIEVSGGIDGTFVKDRLGASLGVSFSRTWTTSTSIQTKGTVTNGNCGVMITKPITTRRTGRVMRGCVGSMTQVGTFVADDRGSGNYNGVSWFAGTVSMCSKRGDNPPLSRCQGGGNFK